MGASPGRPARAASQFVSWPDFFRAILGYAVASGVVPNGSAFWAIDPDSVTRWPAAPPPFLLLVPEDFDRDENGGMGRYGKIWNVNITIYIVIQNIYDESFIDTIAVNSADVATGGYAVAQSLASAMEQVLISTPAGDYATIELPEAGDVGALERFEQANNYLRIPVPFSMLVAEKFLLTNASGMPN